MFADTTQLKVEGLFTNYPHVIYRTNPLSLNKDARYKLVFNNNKTGKSISGTTEVVHNLQMPSILGIQSVNLANPNPLPIGIYPVRNGKIYGLKVIFNYSEKKRIDPGTVYQHKSIEYSLNDIATTNLSLNQTFDFLLNGDDFYNFIGSKIPIDPTLKRPAAFPFVSLDFVFTVGAEDFYIYYSINQPSNNINQNIPDFTNLSDGKGIFSSRNKNTFGNIRLNDASTTMLISGPYTSERFE